MYDRYKINRAKTALAKAIGERFSSEKHFQSHVVALAKINGWRAYHTYDARKSTPGFPDLVLLRDARLIFAELKMDKRKPTKDQRKWLADLEATAAEVYLWRPRDLRRIVKILERT